MQFSQATVERFWNKVEELDFHGGLEAKGVTTGCWQWMAKSQNKDGYGQFTVNKKLYLAHRFSYLIHYGDIPQDLCVCHWCDNKKCVNPQHLYLGTHQENVTHAVKNGLSARGIRNGKAKLNEAKVTRLKSKFARGWSIGKLSRFYGLDWNSVQDILTGKNWKYHPVRTSIDTRPSG